MAAQGTIHLHRSNRTELLAAALAEILRSDPLSPMQEEWIVVQGPGMQRWLSIELAKSLGVWANARFPFPRHLIDTAMRGVLDLEDEEPSVLQPELESIQLVVHYQSEVMIQYLADPLLLNRKAP